MSDRSTGLVDAPGQVSRVLGRVRGGAPGPMLIVLTGIHGNEPAGLRAAGHVLGKLHAGVEIKGDVAILAGNLQALSVNSRFIDLDLNRQWTPELLARLPADGAAGPVEHTEQRELLATLRQLIGEARGQLHFMDLHTSSADGPPFITVGDTLRNRHFAETIPLPLILGLEEQVDGALLELLNNHGFVTLGVEGGRHDDPESVKHHEAVLWLALIGAGLVRADAVPGLDGFQQDLAAARRGLPAVVEVRYRHAVRDGDGFLMEPGFASLDPVRAGQMLARDGKGPIRAEEDGLILLPLYQGQGDDGFFVCRQVRPVWLEISAVLRRLGLNRLMRFLPGVRRHPERSEVLIVNTNVARVYPLEVFHLFGFRKVRQNGTELLVSRRRYDLVPPRQITLS